ncbi:MAG: 4Fe-4S ferredoxin, iron-sulfur binding [Deltaproteobacteria bacterium]|nr:4Fe-4S ferredoxin, iron-sulfur binding [Deltaproteobacteria bacterium]
MTLKSRGLAIEVDPQKCIGCSCCTLACSFHHGREFLPEKSSVHILFDEEGGVHARVLPSCDLCLKEKRALCIEFCPVGAVSFKNRSAS